MTKAMRQYRVRFRDGPETIIRAYALAEAAIYAAGFGDVVLVEELNAHQGR